MLQYIILGFLLHCDMSGYDIKSFMGTSTAYFCDASFGSIYPALKKLEATGLISALEAVEGGKYKKLYSLTDKGRAHFFEWLNQPIAFIRPNQDFLVNIFFYGFLPEEKACELIAKFIGRLEQELAELEALDLKISCQAGVFEASTLDYGKGYYRFAIGWCQSFLQKLENQD